MNTSADARVSRRSLVNQSCTRCHASAAAVGVVALAGVVEERVVGVLLDDEFVDEAGLVQRLLGGVLGAVDPVVLATP